MKRKLRLLLLLPMLFGAWDWNGATITEWNGATITEWNGVTISAVGPSALYTAVTVILDFENDALDTKGVHNFTANGTITYGSSDKKQGSYSATLASGAYFSSASHVDFNPGATGNWSLSAWVKDSNYYDCSLWAKYASDEGIRYVGGWNSTTDQARLVQYAGGVPGGGYTGINLTDNTWYHYVVSYNHSTGLATFWISQNTFGDVANGTTLVSAVGAGDNTADVRVGEYVAGQLDELVFWKGTAITATDAANIFAGAWR